MVFLKNIGKINLYIMYMTIFREKYFNDPPENIRTIIIDD